MAGRRPLLASLLLAGALALTAPQALAQESGGLGGHDASQPIEIMADQLTVEQAADRAVFRGNVQAEQGGMLLRADQLIVYYALGDDNAAAEQAIRRIEVEGNVAITSAEETAVGDSGFYDVAGARIELIDNVVLTSGPNVIRGDRLEIDITQETATVSASPERPAGERVRALFRPASGG